MTTTNSDQRWDAPVIKASSFTNVPPEKMQPVYRLKDDLAHLANVQKATLTTTEYGIEQTHGLFGSDEWWRHIVDGSLPTGTVRGTITRVFMSGHNDWPEFEMQDNSGQLSRWTRETNRPADDVLVPEAA